MKNVLPVLADIANGIFAVVLAGVVTDAEVLWWHFLIGIPLAMLPDLDAIPEILKRGKVAASAGHASDHREGLHHPLLFLLVGLCTVAVSPFFGWLFLFATMLHFVNDLYGTGWGVALFSPFSKTRYKLFCDHNNEFSLHPRAWLRRIRHDELKHEIVEHGMEDWIQVYYLRPTTISVIEYSLFLFALCLLVYSLIY